MIENYGKCCSNEILFPCYIVYIYVLNSRVWTVLTRGKFFFFFFLDEGKIFLSKRFVEIDG